MFKDATFKNTADFSSISSDKSFSLTNTQFHQVPDFTESAFHEPPVLDDIAINQPLQTRSWRWFYNPDGTNNPAPDDPRPADFNNWPIAFARTDTRKYRKLSKMASEAKDYQNQMEFFAQEQRTRRFWHDKPFGTGAGRFWFGLLYDKLSNYGRSFVRPFIGWLATVFAFAVLFVSTGNGWHWASAFYLSLRHGLIISGLTRSGHLNTVLNNLYGTPDTPLPDIPAFAMLAQPLISAIWLFLLLLAIRNQFKIR
jgi:hypothetical protein